MDVRARVCACDLSRTQNEGGAWKSLPPETEPERAGPNPTGVPVQRCRSRRAGWKTLQLAWPLRVRAPGKQLLLGSCEVRRLLTPPEGFCSLVTFWGQQDDSSRVTAPTLLGLLVAAGTPAGSMKQRNVFLGDNGSLKRYLSFVVVKVTRVLGCVDGIFPSISLQGGPTGQG